MRHARWRGGVLVTVAVAAVLGSSSAAASASVAVAVARPGVTGNQQADAPRAVRRAGRFGGSSDGRPPTAVTYDPQLVPVGAGVVVVGVSGRRSVVVLEVAGLLPHRAYGGHVHVRPCGATGAAAGPHYQNVVDPVQPSVDPAYANPDNEVWLDLVTDARGNGRAVSRVRWGFRPGEADSVVIHEHATSAEPGAAGMAGARVGCLTVPF